MWMELFYNFQSIRQTLDIRKELFFFVLFAEPFEVYRQLSQINLYRAIKGINRKVDILL